MQVHKLCIMSTDLNNTSSSDAHINVHIRIVNKHRNVADKLGWEPRRKYATPRFSIGFSALETNSSRDGIEDSLFPLVASDNDK